MKKFHIHNQGTYVYIYLYTHKIPITSCALYYIDLIVAYTCIATLYTSYNILATTTNFIGIGIH